MTIAYVLFVKSAAKIYVGSAYFCLVFKIFWREHGRRKGELYNFIQYLERFIAGNYIISLQHALALALL